MRLPVALLLAVSLTAAPAGAATVVLDHTTPGTVWDGIIDGFPGLFGARDGIPDGGGHPLSVVRKGDVTELRAAMEFPLGALAGAEVVSAVLTFNVDDVLSTLGPGTELEGRAANPILVHTYAGEGALTLADWGRTAEAAVAVATGPGTITDATLAQAGARFFTVDVTARVVQALQAGTSHLGILWRTTDSATGTSLDDGRGGSASGEPSNTSAGSRMPFLTVEVNDAPPPGVCAGVPSCGNGRIDPACGEECDDGDTAGADGCSAGCRFDAFLGGRGRRECILRIAFEHAERTPAGDVARVQSCVDGDPACDANPAPDVCGFVTAACLGAADARLPACAPAAHVTAAVASPGRSRRARATRSRLGTALASTRVPGCSAPVTVDVPVRRRGVKAKARPGKLRLTLRARAPGIGRDADTVSLVCRPGG